MTMKKEPEETAFGSSHLPLQINDLPGVEHTELSRHFLRKRRSKKVDASSGKTDPVRDRAVEGLGLLKGRRFFES
jgi:hypothetical protein